MQEKNRGNKQRCYNSCYSHSTLITPHSPSPRLKIAPCPYLVYSKGPRNMLILPATVFPKLFVTPTLFYLSAHKPLSPKASYPNPPSPLAPQFWPNVLHHFRGPFRI